MQKQSQTDTHANTSAANEIILSDALVALLAAMSRPGVRLLARPDGTSVAVSAGKNGVHRERRIVKSVVNSAQRKGLIDVQTDGETTEWRLTERGRAAYRHALMAKPARHGERTILHANDRSDVVSRAPRTAAAARAPERRSVIEQLAMRKDARGQPLLDALQLAAGKRLAEDFAFGHIHPRVTARWSAEPANAYRRRAIPGAGVELSAATSAAAERVRRALSDLGGDLAGLALDVCCFDKTLQSAAKERHWSTASARLALTLALGRLAQHYGMIAPQPASGRIRQWTTAGFKPTADHWTAKSPR